MNFRKKLAILIVHCSLFLTIGIVGYNVQAAEAAPATVVWDAEITDFYNQIVALDDFTPPGDEAPKLIAGLTSQFIVACYSAIAAKDQDILDENAASFSAIIGSRITKRVLKTSSNEAAERIKNLLAQISAKFLTITL